MPPEALTEPENKIICMCNLARPKTKMIQMRVQVFLGDFIVVWLIMWPSQYFTELLTW